MTITYPACALIVLVGPSGSGKSTFAQKHFKPSQIIASDRCRWMILDSEASQAANDDAFALLNLWLELRLKHRKLTVVDSTALKPSARANLTAIAARHHVPCYALALDVPLDECLRRDHTRAHRSVGEKVVTRHFAQFEQAKREIARDKGFAGYEIVPFEEIASVVITQGVTAENRSRFDVFGDIHGCWAELCDLWGAMGYVWNPRGLPLHPEGRIPVFVGDLTDRGPDSPRVLRTVADLVASGNGLFAPGNHDDKLFRFLKGNAVTLTHGLDLTKTQLDALPDDERRALTTDVLTYLAAAPPYLVLDAGRLVVAHAGIKEEMVGDYGGSVRQMTLYGDVRGFEPGTNKPIRYDWAQEYHGAALVAYGHTPQVEIGFVNNTINLDGGAVFGGTLAALRYPEREIFTVPTRAQYAYHEDLPYSHPPKETP